MYERFKVRSFEGNISSIMSVFSGYIQSFLFWWVVVAILFIWALIQNKKVELKNSCILFLLAFIGVENLIMSRHAILYSYDRMKMCFLFSFISCELLDQILNQTRNTRTACQIIFTVSLICCCLNIYYYISSSDYVWKIDYRVNNKKFADYINKNYNSSILGTEAMPRGYITLLFHRNIFEQHPSVLRVSAKQRGVHYAITLTFKGQSGISYYHVNKSVTSITWNMLELEKAEVYDLITQTTHTLSISDSGEIVRTP